VSKIEYSSVSTATPVVVIAQARVRDLFLPGRNRRLHRAVNKAAGSTGSSYYSLGVTSD